MSHEQGMQELTCCSSKAFAKRTLSAAAMAVGMVTITNWVASGSRKSARVSSMRFCAAGSPAVSSACSYQDGHVNAHRRLCL